jgi:hypothetical protein
MLYVFYCYRCINQLSCHRYNTMVLHASLWDKFQTVSKILKSLITHMAFWGSSLSWINFPISTRGLQEKRTKCVLTSSINDRTESDVWGRVHHVAMRGVVCRYITRGTFQPADWLRLTNISANWSYSLEWPDYTRVIRLWNWSMSL